MTSEGPGHTLAISDGQQGLLRGATQAMACSARLLLYQLSFTRRPPALFSALVFVRGSGLSPDYSCAPLIFPLTIAKPAVTMIDVMRTIRCRFIPVVLVFSGN